MRVRTVRTVVTVALGSALLAGCYKGSAADGDGGGTDSDGTAGDDEEVVEPPPEAGGVGLVGMRRLSRAELDATLEDLLGDTSRPGTQYLPEDVIDPFDNDYTHQTVSTVLIESLETMASDVATRLVADPARRDGVVGCQPSGPADAACMEGFVTLRRPLSAEEIESLTALGLLRRAAQRLLRGRGPGGADAGWATTPCPTRRS